MPFVAKYKSIAAEVLRRRKTGEFFEQFAREMKASVRKIREVYALAIQTQADQPTPKPTATPKPRQRGVSLQPSAGKRLSLEVVPFKWGQVNKD